MKSLVISGGGAKGAYGGGVAQHLIESGNDYEILIGTSTGALLCPLISIGKLDELRAAYTTIGQGDIFKINPFKIKKNQNGSTKISMNYWNVLKNWILHDIRTFGDSSNLEKLISSFLTEGFYNEIRKSNKDVIATVTNITLARPEYHSTRENDRDGFIKWLHASASVPPFMNIIEVEGSQYADGGLLEHTPLQEAIDRGATDIDVIFLKPSNQNPLAIEKIRNPFHYITRIVDLMMSEITQDDIDVNRLVLPKDTEIKITIYPAGRILTNNSLVFDRDTMNQWWDEGYQNALNSYCKSYVIQRNRKPILVFDGVSKTPNE